jgi:hypothetical protein
MKKWLFVISLILCISGITSGQNNVPTPAIKGQGADTHVSGGHNVAGAHGSASLHNSRKKKKRRPVAIDHTAPDQRKIDSIKAEKAKLKK